MNEKVVEQKGSRHCPLRNTRAGQQKWGREAVAPARERCDHYEAPHLRTKKSVRQQVGAVGAIYYKVQCQEDFRGEKCYYEHSHPLPPADRRSNSNSRRMSTSPYSTPFRTASVLASFATDKRPQQGPQPGSNGSRAATSTSARRSTPPERTKTTL